MNKKYLQKIRNLFVFLCYFIVVDVIVETISYVAFNNKNKHCPGSCLLKFFVLYNDTDSQNNHKR